MKGKCLFWMPLITLLVVGVFATFLRVQASAADEGNIVLIPATATVVKGSETTVFPNWPNFYLEVRCANVTNIVGVKFSLQWDPTYINYSGCLMNTKNSSDFIYNATKPIGEYAGPAETGVDNVLGKLSEWYYTELAPYTLFTYSGANTGLITKLNFTYVGPSPTMGYPIDTYINFTDYNDFELMTTDWVKAGVKTKFQNLLPCHLHYEVVETLVHDVEGFNVVTVSNTNVSTPVLNTTQSSLNFNVTGQAGITGFCNVTIPMGLMQGIYNNVTVDGGSPDSVSITENATHTIVYFTYTLASTLQSVTISAEWVIPEFPALTFLLLLMIATITATILGKKIWSTKRRDSIISR